MPKAVVGYKCPNCSMPTRVTDTREGGGTTVVPYGRVRWRRCVNCNHNFITFEVEVHHSQLQALTYTDGNKKKIQTLRVRKRPLHPEKPSV